MMASNILGFVLGLLCCQFAWGKLKTGLCDPREFYEDIPGKPESYLQCTPFEGQVGEWEEVHCPEGHKFLKELQRCMDKTTYKQQASQFRNMVCRAPKSKASEGRECSWTNTVIAEDPGTEKGFLQCSPRSRRSACGVYRQVVCPGNTAYSRALGLCVQVSLQGTCTRGYYAVCRCRGGVYCPSTASCSRSRSCCTASVLCPDGQRALTSCASTSGCPTGFTCINRGCCYTATSVLTCPNGVSATQACLGTGQSTCPVGFTCQGGGCCQGTIQTVTCPNGQLAAQACLGIGQSTCPLGYTCQNGGCCLAVQQVTCPNGQFASLTCVGTGQSTCPVGFTCQNGGCCRAAQQITCPNGQLASQTCVGAGQSTCPIGFTCQNGGCCQSPAVTCPDGQVATQPCAGAGQSTCGAGFQCIGGGCCQVQLSICPDGNPSTQTCVGVGQSTCLNGFFCSNGGCCRTPLCPNGQPAAQVCTPGGACPNGLVCQNGACCAAQLSTCPDGSTAVSQCTAQGTCTEANQFCFAGNNGQGCCVLPVCPNGAAAIAPCGNNLPPCPNQSFQCVNGACCPAALPLCPFGGSASSACTGPGTCPNGEFCFASTTNNQLGCCALPNCADGLPAVASCLNGEACPGGFNCDNGFCCQPQQAQCPNGQAPVQVCGPGGQCPAGSSCVNGQACCQTAAAQCPDGSVPTQACTGTGQGTCAPGFNCVNGGCCGVQQSGCPNGGSSVQICGVGSTCPAGFFCLNDQCCPLPLPVCPNGQRATMTCVGIGQSTCMVGFQCFNGGCCPSNLLAPTNKCPSTQYSVSYCAAFNYRCPSTTTCYSGQCCASRTSQYYRKRRPGQDCTSNSQCAGSPTTSRCVGGSCTCTSGSRSDGVTCSRTRVNFDGSKHCGQFGVDCDTYQATARLEYRNGDRIRHHATMNELGIGYKTQPLFWYTSGDAQTQCNQNSDCTPDMTCIQRKCRPFLQAGDPQCDYDAQCQGSYGARCYSARSRPSSSISCNCLPGDRRCTRNCRPYQDIASYGSERYCINNRLKASDLESYSRSLLRARYATSARNVGN